MYHQAKTVPAKDKSHELGKIKTFPFKKIESMTLSYNITCGEETIAKSEVDRILIVHEGLAHINGSDSMLRDGDVYELAAHSSLRIHGQLKYYLVSKN